MNTKPPPVRRQDGIALWRQIADALRRDIAAGQHPPGGRLPTEAALSAAFAVNRHTIRRALEDLSREGLVRIEQGRGSFVAEDVLDYTVEARTRFSEWIRGHDMEPSGQVLQLREIAADAPTAAAFGIPAGGTMVLLERLGLADGRPVSLTRHHFRLPAMLAALREHASVTQAFRSIGVPDYRRLVTRVTARTPTPTEAALLRMPRNRPLLVAENINVDSAGTVVECAVGCYPTPRVQIVFEP